MIAENILYSLGEIDENDILAACPSGKAKAKKQRRIAIAALAAAVCVLAAAIIVPAALRGRKPVVTEADTDTDTDTDSDDDPQTESSITFTQKIFNEGDPRYDQFTCELLAYTKEVFELNTFFEKNETAVRLFWQYFEAGTHSFSVFVRESGAENEWTKMAIITCGMPYDSQRMSRYMNIKCATTEMMLRDGCEYEMAFIFTDNGETIEATINYNFTWYETYNSDPRFCGLIGKGSTELDSETVKRIVKEIEDENDRRPDDELIEVTYDIPCRGHYSGVKREVRYQKEGDPLDCSLLDGSNFVLKGWRVLSDHSGFNSLSKENVRISEVDDDYFYYSEVNDGRIQLRVRAIVEFRLDGGEFGYEVIDEEKKTCMIVQCPISRMLSGTVVYPDEIDGYNVSAIGENSFICEDMLKNTLRDFFEDGEEYEFANIADYVHTVEIPEGVEYLYKNSVSFPNLKHISLPSSLVNIENGAFCRDTTLDELTIPGNIELFVCCVRAKDVSFEKSEKKLIFPRGELVSTTQSDEELLALAKEARGNDKVTLCRHDYDKGEYGAVFMNILYETTGKKLGKREIIRVFAMDGSAYNNAVNTYFHRENPEYDIEAKVIGILEKDFFLFGKNGIRETDGIETILFDGVYSGSFCGIEDGAFSNFKDLKTLHFTKTGVENISSLDREFLDKDGVTIEFDRSITALDTKEKIVQITEEDVKALFELSGLDYDDYKDKIVYIDRVTHSLVDDL